jgi:hypothetical protein
MTCCTLTATVQPVNWYTHMLSWYPNRCSSFDLRRLSSHSNYPVRPHQRTKVPSTSPQLKALSVFLLAVGISCFQSSHPNMQGWILFIYSITHLRLVKLFITTPRTANTATYLTSLPLETILFSPTSTPRLSHVGWHLSGITTFPLNQALPNINKQAIVSVPSNLPKLNGDFACYSIQCCMNRTRIQLSGNALEAMPWNLHLVTSVYCQFKHWSLKAL